MTAATRAKIAMQIPETNQKTKSIRSACFEAGVGNQGMKRATASATAAAASPTATRRTSTPLRTLASLLNPQAGRRLETGVTSGLRGRCFPVWTRGYQCQGPGQKRASKGD